MSSLQQADFRVESDSFGELKVPNNKYYGAQTARYVFTMDKNNNF